MMRILTAGEFRACQNLWQDCVAWQLARCPRGDFLERRDIPDFGAHRQDVEHESKCTMRYDLTDEQRAQIARVDKVEQEQIHAMHLAHLRAQRIRYAVDCIVGAAALSVLCLGVYLALSWLSTGAQQ